MRSSSASKQHSREEFAALVQEARAAVLETFEEDTLVEAVARELERSAGFTYISDEKLTASMSVGSTQVTRISSTRATSSGAWSSSSRAPDTDATRRR